MKNKKINKNALKFKKNRKILKIYKKNFIKKL